MRPGNRREPTRPGEQPDPKRPAEQSHARPSGGLVPPGTGVLLVNTGSPEAPATAAVRRYLREFLCDPHVLDIHPLARRLLVHLVVLPLRARRSAAAYAKIWTKDGSPLLVHGRVLRDAVQDDLGPETPVELGMRYGSPSLRDGLSRLRERGAARVIVLPLFPQYASATVGSVRDALRGETRRGGGTSLQFLSPFFADPGFLRAEAAVARPVLDKMRPDLVLMSFHGLPESQIRKADESGSHCLQSPHCCDTLTEVNRNCYRAQAFATARLLARELGLGKTQYRVSFQSRLGPARWIGPHTEIVIRALPREGVRRLAVLSPSFTADCLETLEELGMRAREAFLAAGGSEFRLVPSLNAHPVWVKAVAEMIRGVGSVTRPGS